MIKITIIYDVITILLLLLLLLYCYLLVKTQHTIYMTIMTIYEQENNNI